MKSHSFILSFEKQNQAGLVGGVNPFEKYESNWIISPNRDEH